MVWVGWQVGEIWGLQSNKHAILINMNVDGDESKRRLNYYSRSSPRKRRQHQADPNLSPLLPHFPPNSLRTTTKYPSSHRTPNPRSTHSFFRFDVLQVSHSSNSTQILIEDSGEEEILIEDSLQQDEDMKGKVEVVSAFLGKQQMEVRLEKEDGNAVRRSSVSDIRIEDDQIQQEIKQNLDKVEQQESIKKQNQQSMSRQFTFGQELAKAQKEEIELLPHSIREVEQSEPPSPQSPIEQKQPHQQPIFTEYNQENNNQKLPRRPQLDMNLILTSDEVQDYQSPKFNALPLRPFQDKWITAQDNHFLSSPKGNQILIEEEPPSGKSSARTSLSLRPFGHSIALLGEVVELVPLQLGEVYAKMHRKLVGDQINAQEKQQRQEAQIKTLRLLLQLRKQGFGCEEFLLADYTPQQELIQLNRLIIHALIRLAASQR